MDAKSYALSKQYTNLVAIGLASATVDDVNKSITFTLAADGSQHTIHFNQPSDGQDGISVTGVSDKGNGVFTLLFSDGSESDPIQTIKGQKGDKGDKLTFNDLSDAEKESLKGADGYTPQKGIDYFDGADGEPGYTPQKGIDYFDGEKGESGFSPTITENADNTDKIYKLDITTADTTFTTPNLKGADGQGGSGGSGEENVIESIKVNGVAQTISADKSVDITVPETYDDTALVNRVKAIEDDYAKTSDIPSLTGYATETWVNEQGFLTEHQDISNFVQKEDGKGLSSNDFTDSEKQKLAMLSLSDGNSDTTETEKIIMFSSLQLTDNYYVNQSNGELGSSVNFLVSDYIDISGLSKISAIYIQQSAFYDENKQYLSPLGGYIASTVTEETEYSIPAGAKYIRFSVVKSKKDLAYYKIITNTNSNSVFYIGKSRKYTTLRAGIKEAIKTKNSKVYVDDGIYDLCEEFKTEIENANTSQYGIRLANNVHVIFSSGAKVKAIYDNVNSNVETYFAPFYCDEDSDFILENLDIESKNTRYCVHDECGNTLGSFTHKYINCKMSMDNTNPDIALYTQCIGGGLGQHIYIDIVGCYFKSKKGETQKTSMVSYHNNYQSNSKSNINVRNCYFDGFGTFRVTHYGSSADVSEAIINNCSLGNDPYIEHEGGTTGNENMKLISYMNEVRN